jgi:hypothetical protein
MVRSSNVQLVRNEKASSLSLFLRYFHDSVRFTRLSCCCAWADHQIVYNDVKGIIFILVSDLAKLAFDVVISVPIQLGVMSRCPDAILCETVFDQVLNRVAPKVELSLVFIARCVKQNYHHLDNLYNSGGMLQILTGA